MKKLSPKVHLYIANLLMSIGVIYNLVDMMICGISLRLVPTLISIGLVAIGLVWRYTMVKCPHCGDRFKGIHKNLPDTCPNCNEPLDPRSK